ncbi:HD domain-containing protein [Nocardioides sp. GCM10027113]|uniref:HD domain-containing protein n=1 Tax=unclassified Nocardioides TaxID=2615069 RepID=UPI003611B837
MWTDEMNPERFAAAMQLAARLHAKQVRKGTRVPYLSHLLSVAALVAEDDGTEAEVLAAVLHDAAEDQGGESVLRVIEERFGAEVAGIVRECSDSILEVGAAKAPWRERKLAAIERMATASESALRVMAADKLHNTRATLNDVLLTDDEIWDRFQTGREGFLWYHSQVLEILQQRLPKSRSVQLFALEHARLESEATA